MNDSYADIIHHPHHVSVNHPQMSMRNRAAQFAPFAAVVGHTQALDEAARLTEDEITLDIEKIAQINETLLSVEERLARGEHPECRLIFFLPDEKKSGGSYRNLSGKVRRIDRDRRVLFLDDNTEVLLESIIELRMDRPE